MIKNTQCFSEKSPYQESFKTASSYYSIRLSNQHQALSKLRNLKTPLPLLSDDLSLMFEVFDKGVV